MSTFICLFLAVFVGCATPERQEPEPTATRAFRGLWVTRYDFQTPADVRRAVSEAAQAGFTDILWQVRGQGDAFYASEIEPWGLELLRDLPPGTEAATFDPLALAVAETHAKGLRIHAWVNVMPLWKGTVPPKNPRHPFNAHPEWRLQDSNGKPQPLNDHYVIVNPVLEEVHEYIAGVFADIAGRYEIDGLHMDYVRFVSEKMDAATVYPGDKQSLMLFEQATGHTSAESPDDRAVFADWKRSRITDLVRRIGTECKAARSGMEISAAVWRRPELGRDTYLQDGAVWLQEGLIDRALPMIYTDKDAQFESDMAAWRQAAGNRPLSPGLGIYMQQPDQSVRQIEMTRTDSETPSSFALFAYNSLFESCDPNQRKDEKSIAERMLRRRAITESMKAEFDAERLRAGAETPSEESK